MAANVSCNSLVFNYNKTMRLTWSPWCPELVPVTFEKLNMLIEKVGGYLSKTFIHPNDLPLRCNDCEQADVCDKKEANIKFLERNK